MESGDCRSRSVSQRVGLTTPSLANRWCQSEHQPRENGKGQREGQHGHVNLDFVETGNANAWTEIASRQTCSQRAQKAKTARRDASSNDTSDDREQETLRQELTN